MNKNHILKEPKYFPSRPQWSQNAYMPVSMNNRLLRDSSSLNEILSWIFEKTDCLDAIIGDYLHRHNVMINGVSEKDALLICNKMGTQSQAILKDKMKLFPGKTLRIRNTSSFYERKDYLKKFGYFNGLYNNNAEFRGEIEFLVHQFLERQGHVDGNIIQMNHCKDYLLEELVIFEMLAEENYLINIYPGKQLRVFKNIVSGKLVNISKQLEKVSLIEMRFRPAYLSSLINKTIE